MQACVVEVLVVLSCGNYNSCIVELCKARMTWIVCPALCWEFSICSPGHWVPVWPLLCHWQPQCFSQFSICAWGWGYLPGLNHSGANCGSLTRECWGQPLCSLTLGFMAEFLGIRAFTATSPWVWVPSISFMSQRGRNDPLEGVLWFRF